MSKSWSTRGWMGRAGPDSEPSSSSSSDEEKSENLCWSYTFFFFCCVCIPATGDGCCRRRTCSLDPTTPPSSTDEHESESDDPATGCDGVLGVGGNPCPWWWWRWWLLMKNRLGFLMKPNVPLLGDTEGGGVEGRKVSVACLPFLVLVGVTTPLPFIGDTCVEGVEPVYGFTTIGAGAFGRVKLSGFVKSFFRLLGARVSSFDDDEEEPKVDAAFESLRRRLEKPRGRFACSSEDETEEAFEIEVEVKADTNGPVGTASVAAEGLACVF